MNNIKLNLGGELQPGDVVGVSYNNWNTFGWYVGVGKTGNMHFIRINVPSEIKLQYDNFMSGIEKSSWAIKRFSKGLTFKHFSKDYVQTVNPQRAFKVPNPEEFFKDSSLEEDYKKSREALQTLKFPAK